jgi:hypothetical protein
VTNRQIVSAIATVLAAVWLGSGFLAQAGAAKSGAVEINPWLHTATMKVDYDVPDGAWSRSDSCSEQPF